MKPSWSIFDCRQLISFRLPLTHLMKTARLIMDNRSYPSVLSSTSTAHHRFSGRADDADIGRRSSWLASFRFGADGARIAYRMTGSTISSTDSPQLRGSADRSPAEVSSLMVRTVSVPLLNVAKHVPDTRQTGAGSNGQQPARL
jgi:hypothetical protein